MIMMLGGSAMMFHLTNSMFKAAIPNMNDVMKQNPGLVQNMMDAVKNTQREPNAAPPPVSFDDTGRREMQGPGLDLSSLMGGITMPPPPPMNTMPHPVTEQEVDDAASVSDIVSVVSTDSKRGRGRPRGSANKQKKEISL